jgi:hypothetical protein
MKTLDCLSNSSSNTISALLYERTQRDQEIVKITTIRMPSLGLTEFIVVLLYRVAAPRHRCHGHCGGWRHCRPGPAPPFPLPTLAPPHPRVLERPSSPSPNRLMEPSDPDASSWGRRGCPCVIHGWGPCPNRVAPAHGSSSSGQQGEAEGKEEDEPHQISVVIVLVQASLTRQTARISIGPRGQPQGPLTLRTTTLHTSPTPSLVMLPPSALPSTEADTSGSATPQDLKSLCDNRVLWRFARFATPIGKG